MKLLWIVLQGIFLLGCASTGIDKYCIFNLEQKQFATSNLNKIVEDISNDHIFYKLPELFVRESKTYRDHQGCRFILSPYSVDETKGVFDGEILVILDPVTMSVKSVSEIAW